MYCVKCGVKLADSEKICPLCNTKVYHPDMKQPEGEGMYPEKKYPVTPKDARLPQFLISILFLLPLLIIPLCDLQFDRTMEWAGYVVGAILMVYVLAVLPTWFKKPNPVIFIPCDFAAVAVYLQYINLEIDGDWFLTFALPVLGGVCLIVTTVIALLKYVGRGVLYIFGGAFVALGAFMFPVELLVNCTFPETHFIGWSFYSLIALVILGGLLIFLAIYRPARETMERKFFI